MDCMEIVLGPYSLRQMKKSGPHLCRSSRHGRTDGYPSHHYPDRRQKTKVEAKVRGDDKVVPAMVELAKKRSEAWRISTI